MKVDKHGRVRFSHNSVRYAVSANGIRTYDRIYAQNKDFESASFHGDYLDALLQVADGPGWRKLREAMRILEEADQSPFTTHVIIPKHMRAMWKKVQ